MIVEDEGVIALLLSDVLTQMGHEVCAVAATEADAVTCAERSRPDLMIVDAKLRDGSGVSAVGSILQAQSVPYVFMTGDTAGARKLAEGAIVIEKPFDEAELLRAIDQAIAASARPTAPDGVAGKARG